MILQPNNAVRRGQQLAQLSRPQNMLFSGTLALVIGLILLEARQAVATYLLLWCLYAVAATYNNLHDIAIDRLNKRTDNPLASAQLPTNIARWWLIVNCLVIVGLQFGLTQPLSLLLTISYLLLLYAYSHPKFNLQSRGVLGLLLLAVCYGSLPLWLVILPAQLPQALWLGALQIPLLLPGLLAKDYKDEAGDRALGKRTVLVRHGPAYVRKLAFGSYVIGLGGALVLGRASWPVVLYIIILGIGGLWSLWQLHTHRATVSPYFIRVPQLLLLMLDIVLVASLA